MTCKSGFGLVHYHCSSCIVCDDKLTLNTKEDTDSAIVTIFHGYR